METKVSSTFWWLKTPTKEPPKEQNSKNSSLQISVPKLDLDISSSLADFLEKEQNILNSNTSEKDVGSILEEISRVAAQSPLGPYEPSKGDRSIEDIMREAERIYMESSKSFEQLSQRSKTSQNVTELNSSASGESKLSTPTPKSVSPLPHDDEERHNLESESDTYSEDFSEISENNSKKHSDPSPEEKVDPIVDDHGKSSTIRNSLTDPQEPDNNNIILENSKYNKSPTNNNNMLLNKNTTSIIVESQKQKEPPVVESSNAKIEVYEEQIAIKDDLIKTLQEDNKQLRSDVRSIKAELQQTNTLLEQTRASLSAKTLSSPEINLELDKALEELKDSREINTALQLQLNTINQTHCLLKNSYEDLLASNKNLERRVVELDTTLSKYKQELAQIQSQKDKLLENEVSLSRLLEIEKLQAKSLKLQNEKDAKCIQDLNRQIKEMERIIARKHPDSVSALIVAAKNDASDSNLTARKILEDRIKTLEQEAQSRDSQSSKVFLDIQDKFNQMKLKYESHIEDLELHVSDLKQQLKRTIDTYDVYTQTASNASSDEEKIPQKDTFTTSTQTDQKLLKRSEKVAEIKEESHLIATIRGLQADLTNKEKVLSKLQREMEELRKTNRKLQKEREGSLRSLNDSHSTSNNSRKEFRSYPEKLSLHQQQQHHQIGVKSSLDEDEIKFLKADRDKMKQQLCRIEEDYQALKNKRLHDLNALQEAHEREIAAYLSNVSPLREQLEIQQATIAALQTQLQTVKDELAIVRNERDRLRDQLGHMRIASAMTSPTATVSCKGMCDASQIEVLQRKIAFLEMRYEERELQLRSVLHGLQQKYSNYTASNRSCEQCSLRQNELFGYKMELDQILAQQATQNVDPSMVGCALQVQRDEDADSRAI